MGILIKNIIMTTNPQFDISILPENARRQLSDFYIFLKQQYSLSNNIKRERKPSQVDAKYIETLKNRHIKINQDIDIDDITCQINNGLS
jgi:hypothetical protein